MDRHVVGAREAITVSQFAVEYAAEGRDRVGRLVLEAGVAGDELRQQSTSVGD